MRELAVDFGSSNTVAAVRAGSRPVRLLTFDGRAALASSVWLAPDERGLVVGREADRQAGLDPSRYERNPKRRIDDGEVLLGDTVVTVQELITAVLRVVDEEATRQLGGPPERVVLTHPAGWRRSRTATLRAAGDAVGWASVRLVAEPVAAAAHFTGLPDLPSVAYGESVAVYDMGAGTTDVAVVRRMSTGWQVLAEAGVDDVGGLDLDQLLLDHIAGGAAPSPALVDHVRSAREALSRYPQADIPLPAPLSATHVTRSELEDLLRPVLERTVTLLTDAVGPTVPSRIFLVGGACRTPLIARMITEGTGVVPVVVDSPETSVVLGALGASEPTVEPDLVVQPESGERARVRWWPAVVAGTLALALVAVAVLVWGGQDQVAGRALGGAVAFPTTSTTAPTSTTAFPLPTTVRATAQTFQPGTQDFRVELGKPVLTSDGLVEIRMNGAHSFGEVDLIVTTPSRSCTETKLVLGESLVIAEPTGWWTRIILVDVVDTSPTEDTSIPPAFFVTFRLTQGNGAPPRGKSC